MGYSMLICLGLECLRWTTGGNGEANDSIPSYVLTSHSRGTSFAALMGALISDYGVHISMTFSASPFQNQRVAIIENPDTGLAGVLVITDEQTCIALSGEGRQEFIRPPDHPVGAENEAPKT